MRTTPVRPEMERAGSASACDFAALGGGRKRSADDADARRQGTNNANTYEGTGCPEQPTARPGPSHLRPSAFSADKKSAVSVGLTRAVSTMVKGESASGENRPGTEFRLPAQTWLPYRPPGSPGSPRSGAWPVLLLNCRTEPQPQIIQNRASKCLRGKRSTWYGI
jgi:hypothetical protein